MNKGVILAGGTGQRLYPLTKVTNKHLLPVGDIPMIYHPIKKLVEAGINNILIITGLEHMGDVVRLLGSGKEFECSFTYKVQDEAGGIAQALNLAKEFCNKEKFIVILGDNIFEDSLTEFIKKFEEQDHGARLMLKKVHDPSRYGVPTFNGDKIIEIIEKPKIPKTNYAVTGIYGFDQDVFEYIKKCKPSNRGELEISDVNTFYAESGNCEYEIFNGWWTDAGTLDSLQVAQKLLQKNKNIL
ncbi:spore coat protein [Candidatus Marinamargulisbacteria bacterium SCGC AG-410-N11]|nr:spore coat protein [Candidatus Marinamargulisbacteria bacterium SCGC AG-410-N11]